MSVAAGRTGAVEERAKQGRPAAACLSGEWKGVRKLLQPIGTAKRLQAGQRKSQRSGNSKSAAASLDKRPTAERILSRRRAAANWSEKQLMAESPLCSKKQKDCSNRRYQTRRISWQHKPCSKHGLIGSNRRSQVGKGHCHVAGLHEMQHNF